MGSSIPLWTSSVTDLENVGVGDWIPFASQLRLRLRVEPGLIELYRAPVY